ncbi:MAG: alpha/beta hydrolase [Acidothermales bacterium]|nr:alpha/beta hydrolase [Acidothermales bacterium]
MNRGPKVVGIVAGATAGLLAAGAAAGIAAERYAVGRIRLGPDPEAREPFGRLRGRPLTVLADDGVPLHVEIDGDDDADVTVLFCHGYGLREDSWHYQRRYLRHLGRLVFWDQRSHGRSGHSPEEHCTIDQLGRDLYAVLNAAVPRGPVVLVGHSMGGMTIMALADQRPELFGDRVVGVGLIATAADPVSFFSKNLPHRLERAAETVITTMGKQVALVEGARRLAGDLLFLVIRTYSFGSRRVSPSVAAFQERMANSTPVDVLAAYYPTFRMQEKRAALSVLDRVESLVVVGSEDRMTPVEHAETIVQRMSGAEYVVVPGAGHMVMLEEPGLVNELIGRLVERAMVSVESSGESAS